MAHHYRATVAAFACKMRQNFLPSEITEFTSRYLTFLATPRGKKTSKGKSTSFKVLSLKKDHVVLLYFLFGLFLEIKEIVKKF